MTEQSLLRIVIGFIVVVSTVCILALIAFLFEATAELLGGRTFESRPHRYVLAAMLWAVLLTAGWYVGGLIPLR